MISLYNIPEESLLGNFEDIEASMDPIEEIKQFIKDNYSLRGHLHISKEPNENGRYEIDCRCNIYVKNYKLTSLTNGMFEWGVVKGDFSCCGCRYLNSLKGTPRVVKGHFLCSFCEKLTSLEGSPKKVGGSFDCAHCKSLTSLEGVPKEVNGGFYCYGCSSLTSLEGMPKEIKHDFDCCHCGKVFNKIEIENLSKIGGKIYMYKYDNFI